MTKSALTSSKNKNKETKTKKVFQKVLFLIPFFFHQAIFFESKKKVSPSSNAITST
jgi:hypothetical protein